MICALQQHSLYLLYDNMHIRRILHSYRHTHYYNIIVRDGFKTLVHKSKTIIYIMLYIVHIPTLYKTFFVVFGQRQWKRQRAAAAGAAAQYNNNKKICTRPQHSPMKSLYNIMPTPDTRRRGYILCYMNRTTTKPSGKDRRDFCPAQCI